MSPFSKILLRMRWAVNTHADAGSLIRQMHVLPLVKRIAIGMDAKHILDAGCGSGVYAFSLAKQLPQRAIVGLDINPDYYQQCLTKKEYFHRHNTQFILGSLTQPFGEESYDLIYSVDVLEHIENDTEALKSICNGLKPDGYLVLHVPRANPEYIFRVTDKLADEKRGT